MKIGIIGAGHIGGNAARLFVEAGHEVAVANSRGAETLRDFVAAILLTYPYQVVRSRIQNHATSHIYPNISTCIRLTYTQEGLRAFYKGLVPNLVRIIPGTCVTFVVYENVSWALKGLARRRMLKEQQEKREQWSLETSSST